MLGKEPVFVGGACVGYVTSAAYGYTIGRPDRLRLAADRAGGRRHRGEIGYFDRRVAAAVAAEPLVDPEWRASGGEPCVT